MSLLTARSVSATPEAIELIEELKRFHGPLAFLQDSDESEGGETMCLTRGELLPTYDDIRIGAVGGAPVYVDALRYERWGRPELLIDVAQGPATGLALTGLEDRHFIARRTQPGRTVRRQRGEAVSAR